MIFFFKPSPQLPSARGDVLVLLFEFEMGGFFLFLPDSRSVRLASPNPILRAAHLPPLHLVFPIAMASVLALNESINLFPRSGVSACVA